MTAEKLIRGWDRVYARANLKDAAGILRSFKIRMSLKTGHLPHESAGRHTWNELIREIPRNVPGITRRIVTFHEPAHS